MTNAVPNCLTERLIEKLQGSIFDIGNVISLAQEESGRVVVIAQTDLEPEEDVWLVDHQWTFSDLDSAKQQLKTISSLRSRVSEMVNVPLTEDGAPVDSLWAVLSFFFGSYQESNDDTEADNNSVSGNSEKIFYLLDEVGSRFIASDDGKATFASTLVTTANLTYTAVWCVKKVTEGEILTCSGLPKGMRRLAELQSTLSFDDIDLGEDEYSGEQLMSRVAVCLHNLFKTVDYTTKEVSERLGVLTKDGIEQGSGIGGSCFPYAEVSSVENRDMYKTKLISSFSEHPTPTELGFITVVTMFLLGLPVEMSHLQSSLGLILSQVKASSPSSKCTDHATSSVPTTCDSTSNNINTTTSSSEQLKNMVNTIIAWLQHCHLIYKVEGTKWISLLQISPVDVPNYPQVYSESIPQCQVYVATDYSHCCAMPGIEPVMSVGYDTLGLIHGIANLYRPQIPLLSTTDQQPNNSIRRGLDLCSGCGIQALVAHKGGLVDEVVCIERNPRAARFARFNAALNCVEDAVTVIEGSITIDLPSLLLSTIDEPDDESDGGNTEGGDEEKDEKTTDGITEREEKERELERGSHNGEREGHEATSTFDKPFDLVMINPPYIPGLLNEEGDDDDVASNELPESESESGATSLSQSQNESHSLDSPPSKNTGNFSLLQYGAGGYHGERVTKAALASLKPPFTKDSTTIFVAANFCNVASYADKISTWRPWARGGGTGYKDTIHLFHGLLWSIQEYAELICVHHPEQIPGYLTFLRDTGVLNVSNGILRVCCSKEVEKVVEGERGVEGGRGGRGGRGDIEYHSEREGLGGGTEIGSEGSKEGERIKSPQCEGININQKQSQIHHNDNSIIFASDHVWQKLASGDLPTRAVLRQYAL